jgi:hypothetical protein
VVVVLSLIRGAPSFLLLLYFAVFSVLSARTPRILVDDAQ